MIGRDNEIVFNKDLFSFKIKHRNASKSLRAACSNGHLYLCRIEKFAFLKLCQEEASY